MNNDSKTLEKLIKIYVDDYRKFRFWIEKALLYGFTAPISPPAPQEDIIAFLLNIYRRSHNREFQHFWKFYAPAVRLPRLRARRKGLNLKQK